MDLKVLWMYHDVMDLYGDRGNIRVLEMRCKARGIDVSVETCGVGGDKKISDFDLLFIGGGADREQNIVCGDLLGRKSEIVNAMDSGTFALLICGGYQFFGKHYIDNENRIIEGLGILDYATESDPGVGRCIGNIEVEAELDGEKMTLVGFENHGGQTKGVKTPLGKVIIGHGNVYRGEYEGYYDGRALATYMHGPLLPKNPEVADFVIRKALKKRHGDVALALLDDKLEHAAKDAVREMIR
jgi:CobQ-like glutamine amidotransferase family enzyme